jgi:hypothetical protein
MRIVSISPDEGGDGEDIEGIEIEQNKGEVPPPRDKEDCVGMFSGRCACH